MRGCVVGERTRRCQDQRHAPFRIYKKVPQAVFHTRQARAAARARAPRGAHRSGGARGGLGRNGRGAAAGAGDHRACNNPARGRGRPPHNAARRSAALPQRYGVAHSACRGVTHLRNIAVCCANGMNTKDSFLQQPTLGLSRASPRGVHQTGCVTRQAVSQAATSGTNGTLQRRNASELRHHQRRQGVASGGYKRALQRRHRNARVVQRPPTCTALAETVVTISEISYCRHAVKSLQNAELKYTVHGIRHSRPSRKCSASRNEACRTALPRQQEHCSHVTKRCKRTTGRKVRQPSDFLLPQTRDEEFVCARTTLAPDEHVRLVSTARVVARRTTTHTRAAATTLHGFAPAWVQL